MRYVNLDIEAFDYARDEGGERFSVRVACSPAGEQKLTEAEHVTLPPDLRQRLRLLEQRRLDVAQTIAFGEDLAAALLPPRARLFFTRSIDRLRDDEALRLRLKLDALSLVDLPWEYAYVGEADAAGQKGPGGFLVLNRRLSLVRYEVMGQSPTPPSPVADGRLRVVSIMANPSDTDDLHLDAERDLMESALRGIDKVEVEFYPNATVDTLLDALSRDAHVFHFAGHGVFESEFGGGPFDGAGGQGYLLLVGDDGKSRRLPSGSLALNLRNRKVRLAVLGACEAGRRDTVNAWTGVAPALTLAGIPAVVGMQMTVRDHNVVAFTHRMYQALADGKTVDEAVTVGRIAVFSRATAPEERDWGVPVLYQRTDDGVAFTKSPRAADAPAVELAGETAKPEEFRIDKVVLRTVLVNFFSRDELDALCFDLQDELSRKGLHAGPISLEIVGGSSKTAMALNLIQYLDRRGLLPHLVEMVRSTRPDVI